MGTVWETPSPESMIIPVVRPEAYMERTACLVGDIHGRGVEGFEHDLGQLLPIGLEVEGSLSQEDGVLLGGDTELVSEGVVPDLFYGIPVGHDVLFDRVLEVEDTPLHLGIVSDVEVSPLHAMPKQGVYL